MNFMEWVTKMMLFLITSLAGVFSPGIVPQLPGQQTNMPSTIASSSLSAPTHTDDTAQTPPLLPKTPVATKLTPKTPITPPIVKISQQANTGASSKLDALEIILITNQQRAKDGANPLTWNAKLAEEAMAKAKDMIAKQYFAHKSPDGINVSDLANIHGYSFSLVGENLALGDFKNSADVMDGWMNSPGHRANILKKAYTEIGVAAILGPYQGRQVWYAVQEFGRPSPDCPSPDTQKEALIKNTEAKMDELATQLTALKQKIDAGTGTRDEINAEIDQYNAIASTHNDLLVNLKTIINVYNNEVATYNACIAKEEAIIGPSSTSTAE